MKMAYQVFLELPNGGRLWVTSAPSLRQAKDQLAVLSSTQPGVYLIADARSRRAVTDCQVHFTRVWGTWLREIVGVIDGVGQSLTQRRNHTPHAALPE